MGQELFGHTNDFSLFHPKETRRGRDGRGLSCIPKALFDLSAVRMTVGGYAGYALTADGQRLVFVSKMAETGPSSLAVVGYWTAEVKKWRSPPARDLGLTKSSHRLGRAGWVKSIALAILDSIES